MNIFEMDSITAGYGGVPVIKDLSTSVREGEFLSIIGPNGAGKSTFLKILSGALSPERGKVLFKGTSLREYRHRELAKHYSTVHQAIETMTPFSVYEFIRLGRFPHQDSFTFESKDDAEAVDWAMKTTGIGNLVDRRLTELSGGELQLVRIAHALAQNNKVILLDEPVSHLDIQHAVLIMDILWNLNREGATIITVLHDINLASDYSSRIIGMKKGEVFFSGEPTDVLRYDLVESLFNTSCIVLRNPTTGRPFVYPVPGYIK